MDHPTLPIAADAPVSARPLPDRVPVDVVRHFLLGLGIEPRDVASLDIEPGAVTLRLYQRDASGAVRYDPQVGAVIVEHRIEVR